MNEGDLPSPPSVPPPPGNPPATKPSPPGNLPAASIPPWEREGGEPQGSESVWSRLSLHEFLVDVFGGLVPGVLFSVVVASSLLPAIDALSAALTGQTRRPSPWHLAHEFMVASAKTPSMIWVALFSFVLMVGYVVGHLFLRRDPKIPDQNSFARLKRRAAKSDETYLREEFACANADECQFPYAHMNSYLRKRGHEHLALIADHWSDQGRSKTYINRLKLRLAYWYPAKYRPVVRNEAHVRLVTSTWYMGQALWKVTLFVSAPLLALSGVCYWLHHPKHWWTSVPWLFDAAVPTLLAVAVGLYATRACESFLHYQRLREVYAVLELAYIAHHRAPILDGD